MKMQYGPRYGQRFAFRLRVARFDICQQLSFVGKYGVRSVLGFLRQDGAESAGACVYNQRYVLLRVKIRVLLPYLGFSLACRMLAAVHLPISTLP